MHEPPRQPPPPQPQQPPYYGYGYAPYTPRETNGLAIAAVIVACAGLAPVGLVLGIVALKQIDNSNGTQDGRGLAIAGIAIGGVLTAIAVLGLIVLIGFAAAL